MRQKTEQKSKPILYAPTSPEQHEAVRLIAFEQKKSMADIIREAVDQYLERMKLEGKS